MKHCTLAFFVVCSAVLCASCGKSGDESAPSRYATSRPAGVPDTQPEVGPKAHQGPAIARQPENVSRPIVTGPFPLTKSEGKEIVLPDGLKYIDLKEGTGPQPKAHQIVWVDYTGWLEDGKMFDTSRNQGIPFHFWLGEKGVIAGWDEGVATMKVGGKRRLIVPAALAYGESGRDTIPPNATLIFDVDLLAITEN